MRSLKNFHVQEFLLNKCHQYSTLYFTLCFISKNHVVPTNLSTGTRSQIEQQKCFTRELYPKVAQGEGHGIQRWRGIRFFVQHRKGLCDSHKASRIALTGGINRCGAEPKLFIDSVAVNCVILSQNGRLSIRRWVVEGRRYNWHTNDTSRCIQVNTVPARKDLP